MAKRTFNKKDKALVKEVMKVKPKFKHRDPRELPNTTTVKSMMDASKTALEFFTTNPFENPSARAFKQRMLDMEKALIDSYKHVKSNTKTKNKKVLNARINFGQTTEAVLLYGMNLSNLFRHEAWKAAYLGGDVELIDSERNEILGVQVKSPGGKIRINYSIDEGFLKQTARTYGGNMDDQAFENAMEAIIRNSKVTLNPNKSDLEKKNIIANFYVDLSVNTEYMMLRASVSDYFFVTMKMSEFPKFVKDNPHLFAISKTSSKNKLKKQFPYGMVYKGIKNDSDLWRIGTQKNFLAIHYPVASYFYRERGVIRGGKVSPSVTGSNYSVGQITKYNQHVSDRGKDFEAIHNGFFGSYGYVKSKY